LDYNPKTFRNQEVFGMYSENFVKEITF